MKPFVVNARRAVFGLPFYAGWNLVAFTKEQETRAERAKVAVYIVLGWIITTALWAAVWMLVLWLMLKAMS